MCTIAEDLFCSLGVDGLPADGKLDVTKLGLPPLSMRVRVGRNLADFPLPGFIADLLVL